MEIATKLQDAEFMIFASTTVHSLVPTRFQPRFIRSCAWLASSTDSRRSIDIVSVLPHFILVYDIQEPPVPRGLPIYFDHHLSLPARMPNGGYIT